MSRLIPGLDGALSLPTRPLTRLLFHHVGAALRDCWTFATFTSLYHLAGPSLGFFLAIVLVLAPDCQPTSRWA